MLPAGSRATGDQSQRRLIALSKGDRGGMRPFALAHVQEHVNLLEGMDEEGL